MVLPHAEIPGLNEKRYREQQIIEHDFHAVNQTRRI